MATANFDYLVADPARAPNAKNFPGAVVPGSIVGYDRFYAYFNAAGIASQSASFGNEGTDSNAFSLVAVPNTGILTQQDCCKRRWEVAQWGGLRGNYEGMLNSFNGGLRRVQSGEYSQPVIPASLGGVRGLDNGAPGP